MTLKRPRVGAFSVAFRLGPPSEASAEFHWIMFNH